MTENKVRQWTEAGLSGLDNRIKTRIGTQTRIPVSLDSHIKNIKCFIPLSTSNDLPANHILTSLVYTISYKCMKSLTLPFSSQEVVILSFSLPPHLIWSRSQKIQSAGSFELGPVPSWPKSAKIPAFTCARSFWGYCFGYNWLVRICGVRYNKPALNNTSKKWIFPRNVHIY